MGVVNLFTELANYTGVVQNRMGADEQLVAELCGQTLAIDTSVWIFQCSQQQDLKDAIYDEHARVLYTMIHRIISLLRYGVTPIFVLEGDTPEAKRGRLQQRSLAKGLGCMAGGNRRGGRHDALGRRVVQLLDLMGLPHVDAPGEAEAMCAALVTAGLADAVVSTDVDALLFGAPCQYRECRLQFDNPKHNVVERVDPRAAARAAFGLTQPAGGCALALQTVAVLCGCDYSVAGGRGVGVKLAMGAVQQLTRGRQSDAHVPGELLRLLRTGPDPAVMELKACSGCKTCGHEKHGRKPCELCGPGACRPKEPGAGCSCRFHSSEPERVLMRVISRAVSTSPSFAADCETALEAFAAEGAAARREALALRGRGGLRWVGRPDAAGVFELMHPLLGGTSSDPNKLLWTYEEVRDKLRPVLMEWDMRQGPNPPAEVAAQVQFRPARIKQEAAKDGGKWAYLVEFERLGADPDAEFDRGQMRSSKLVKGRHVRKSLVERLWPQLLSRKEEEEQVKLSQQASKGTRKAAGAPRGRRAAAAGAGSGSTATGSVGLSAGVSGSPLASDSPGRTGTGTGAGGGGGGGSAKSASRTVSRAGLSNGSREVMQRFLAAGGRGGGGGGGDAGEVGGGGAAAGGRQPGAGASQQEQEQDGGYGWRGGVGGPAMWAAAVGDGIIGSDSDSEGDGDAAGLLSRRRARGPAAPQQQQPQQQQVGPMLPPRAVPRAAAAPAVAAAAALAPAAAAPRVGRPLAKTQYSCSDAEDGDGSDDDGCDIPASMEELLAQVGGGRTGRAQAQASSGAAAGGGAAARPGAAAGAGPAHEWPFRPHPTGPGPGRGRGGAGAGGAGPGAGSGAGAAGAAAALGGAAGGRAHGGGAGAGAGAGGRWGAAGAGTGAGSSAGAAGGGAAAAAAGSPHRGQQSPGAQDVEFMDLTDSPAPAPAPPRQEQRRQQQQQPQQSPMGRTGSTSTDGAAAAGAAGAAGAPAWTLGGGRQGSGEEAAIGAQWGVGSSNKPPRPGAPRDTSAAAAGGLAGGGSDGARRSLFQERGAAGAGPTAAAPTQSGPRGGGARGGTGAGGGGAGAGAGAAGRADADADDDGDGGGGGGAAGESPLKRQRSIGSTIDNPSDTNPSNTTTGGAAGSPGAGGSRETGGSTGGGAAGAAAAGGGEGAAAAAAGAGSARAGSADPIPVPGGGAARRPAAACVAVDLTLSSDEEEGDEDGARGGGGQGRVAPEAGREAAGRQGQGQGQGGLLGRAAAPPAQQRGAAAPSEQQRQRQDGDEDDDDDEDVIIVGSQ